MSITPSPTVSPSTGAPIRLLITGITSIHGWPLFCHLHTILPKVQLFGIRPPKMRVPRGNHIRAVCVTNQDALIAIKKEFQPTHIIHGAGVCDLDVCQERPEWAESINTLGSHTVAKVFGDSCYMLHLSADLIFSGNNTPIGGYEETDTPDPVSVAGSTLLKGEQAIESLCKRPAIIRLGLPIGRSITRSKGAIDWIESRLSKNRPVTLFHDEWRSCISCRDINAIVTTILLNELTGTFHVGGPTPASLHEIGQFVVALGSYPPNLLNSIGVAEEIDGPPRMKNVSLCSKKIEKTLTDSHLYPLKNNGLDKSLLFDFSL